MSIREDLRNARERIGQARLAVQALWTTVDMPNGDLDTSIYLLTQQLVEASHDIEGALEWLDRAEPRCQSAGAAGTTTQPALQLVKRGDDA